MVNYSYSTKNITENTAKAVGMSLPISTKHSVEICNFIRSKNLKKAKSILDNVTEKKLAIPFRRSSSAAHKKSVGPGRYPTKACKEILNLLNAVEANAQYKGLSGDLKIVHVCAQKASTPWHFGRKRRRRTKRTHVEVIVEEVKKPEKKKKEVKERGVKKTESKKPEEKKEIKKEKTTEPKKQEIKETKIKKEGETQEKEIKEEKTEKKDVEENKK